MTTEYPMCSCELESCEDAGRHLAGNCPEPAVIDRTDFGICWSACGACNAFSIDTAQVSR